MKNKPLLTAHFSIFIFLVILAFLSKGYGNDGDSITHYYIARNSWFDAQFFFHHWGKPFFTLWASPWAQFGYTGIKVFNIFCGVASSYVTCLLAYELNKKWHWAIIIIAFTSPAFYTLLFSGLTEPFSALAAILSVWLIYTGRVTWGFILASFLPFCRSEAQLYLIFFGLFALLNNHWKKIPFLFTGYILYSIIGGIYLKDFLWVFDMPYKADNNFYGKGEWTHYLDQLTFMIGGIQILLLTLGIVQMIINLIHRKISWKKEPLLIQSLFVFLILAHTIVWALGTYGSAGMARVLILGFPFMWLMILDGVNLIGNLSATLVKKNWGLPVITMVLHFIAIFNQPVTYKYYRKNVQLTDEHKSFKEEIASHIKKNFPESNYLVFDPPYMALALNIDFMNRSVRGDWNVLNRFDQLPSGTLLIWDNQVAQSYGIHSENLVLRTDIQEVKSWKRQNLEFKLFIKK